MPSLFGFLVIFSIHTHTCLLFTLFMENHVVLSSADASSQAWVTLATNDAYATGALVLAHSLVRAGTTRKKVVMVSGDIKQELLDALNTVFDEVQDVALLDSLDSANLALLERPELGVTFTKLHCWNLTKYSKCVFLDADTLVCTFNDDKSHCDGKKTQHATCPFNSGHKAL